MRYVIAFFASLLVLSCSTKSNPTSANDNSLVLPAVFKGTTSFYAGDTLSTDHFPTKNTTLTLTRADSLFSANVEDTSTLAVAVLHYTMSGNSTDHVNNLTYNITRLGFNGTAVFDAAKINLTITIPATGITTKYGTPGNLIMKVKR